MGFRTSGIDLHFEISYSVVMSSKQLPWIEYLIHTVKTEPDRALADYGATFDVILQEVRFGIAKRNDVMNQLAKIKEDIMSKCSSNKYRANLLIDGVIEFIGKEFKDN